MANFVVHKNLYWCRYSRCQHGSIFFQSGPPVHADVARASWDYLAEFVDSAMTFKFLTPFMNLTF